MQMYRLGKRLHWSYFGPLRQPWNGAPKANVFDQVWVRNKVGDPGNENDQSVAEDWHFHPWTIAIFRREGNQVHASGCGLKTRPAGARYPYGPANCKEPFGRICDQWRLEGGDFSYRKYWSAHYRAFCIDRPKAFRSANRPRRIILSEVCQCGSLACLRASQ